MGLCFSEISPHCRLLLWYLQHLSYCPPWAWDPSVLTATVPSLSFTSHLLAQLSVAVTAIDPYSSLPFVSFENKTPLVWLATRW